MRFTIIDAKTGRERKIKVALHAMANDKTDNTVLTFKLIDGVYMLPPAKEKKPPAEPKRWGRWAGNWRKHHGETQSDHRYRKRD